VTISAISSPVKVIRKARQLTTDVPAIVAEIPMDNVISNTEVPELQTEIAGSDQAGVLLPPGEENINKIVESDFLIAERLLQDYANNTKEFSPIRLSRPGKTS
jgi:hypothetical protein